MLFQLAILVYALKISTTTDIPTPIVEDEHYYKFIDVYQYDANRFRRSLHATNMVVMKWNNSLEKDSKVAGMSMIKHFGCNQQWNCTTSQCGGIIRMQLRRNEKLQHKILRSYDTADHAMGRMFEFLGKPSPKRCGAMYEIFDNKDARCKEDAIKIYSKTQQVGCSLLKCLKPVPNQRQQEAYRHFVCMFDPLVSSLPVDSSERLELYKPSRSAGDVCTQCPSEFPACENGLCVSSTCDVAPSTSLPCITTIMLLLVKQ